MALLCRYTINNYSLTHSCMLETRDIHMYTSDVYASAYVMYQSLLSYKNWYFSIADLH